MEENFKEKKSRSGSGQGIVEQREVIANSKTECGNEEVAGGHEQRNEEKNREVQVDYQKNLIVPQQRKEMLLQVYTVLKIMDQWF